MEWWKIVYWLLGTIGVAGTIALAVFFPAVFSLAFRAVAQFFTLVLSYRAGCALVAAIAAALVADYWRHDFDDKRHAAEVAAFERKQDERDQRIKQETRDSVLAEIASAAKENSATDSETKDFTDALPKADNLYRVGDAACSLRRIAGQTGCGPDGATGVPKADRTNEGRPDHQRHGLSSIVGRIPGHHQQGQQGHRAQEQLR